QGPSRPQGNVSRARTANDHRRGRTGRSRRRTAPRSGTAQRAGGTAPQRQHRLDSIRSRAMTWVVDASVAVKWVVPETLSANAERVLASEEELLAPDLLLVEAANALWKKTERREISAAEAGRALDVVLSSGLVIRPSRPLLHRALTLAGRLGHPVYDC